MKNIPNTASFIWVLFCKQASSLSTISCCDLIGSVKFKYTTLTPIQNIETYMTDAKEMHNNKLK